VVELLCEGLTGIFPLDCIDLVKDNELEILKRKLASNKFPESGRSTATRDYNMSYHDKINMNISDSKLVMRNEPIMQPERDKKRERKPIFASKPRMDISPTRNIGVLSKDYPIRIEENYSVTPNKIHPR